MQVADDQNADVHLVNAGEVQLADGSMATVGVFDVDGQEVSVVDFDQDGNPDVAPDMPDYMSDADIQMA